MTKQIFPKEIIENTVEVHQFKHSHTSKIIYATITFVIIATLIALPFINITIYNTSQGYIKPDRERITLQNHISGTITSHALIDNTPIKKGDTLLVVKNHGLHNKTSTANNQIEEIKQFIHDLTILTKSKNVLGKLQSLKFKQEVLLYKQKQQDLNIRFKKTRVDYNRNKKLFEKGVIAKVTLNDVKLQYDIALQAIQQLKKQQKNTWQSLYIDYNNKLQELENTLVELDENNTLSVIEAPISGTLFINKGIETGSFINAGFELGEISPNTNLLVECYMSPADIGLLKKGNEVNYQITAFNYNQWGLATGKIIAIYNDVELINNTPFFKVKCSLDQQHLSLTNGFKGYLKKGMTLNARFELTERTLFDLLYDKMDDWLNPTNQIAKN